MKICHGVRGRGSKSAFRCLRPKLSNGRMKRGKKVRTGNHIRRRLHKILLNIVNKRKSKKEQKQVSKMKRNNETRRGKYISASVKQQQKGGTKHKKLGKRKKGKLQRKLKRKKYIIYNQRRQKQKLSKIIHIHIRQPSRMRIFRSKQRKRIKTKQRGKSQRGAVTLFLEK